jgi:5-methylcytosine-specific restriction endonuclease McrA
MVSRDKRVKVRDARARLLADDPTCHYCLRDLSLTDSTLDHIVPVSQGGAHEDWNWLLACEPCNSNRSDRIYFCQWDNGRPCKKCAAAIDWYLKRLKEAS